MVHKIASDIAVEGINKRGGLLGKHQIEMIYRDDETKPDVGAAIARKWYDVDGVKMITGLGTSSVALAVRKISQEKGLIDINTGAASSDLTGPACSATGAIPATRRGSATGRGGARGAGSERAARAIGGGSSSEAGRRSARATPSSARGASCRCPSGRAWSAGW